MKRKRLPPDDRLDWRDPDMPVIRAVLINGKPVVKEIPPQIITNYYNTKINSLTGYWFEGHYSKDPSYNWAEQKKSKNNLK